MLNEAFQFFIPKEKLSPVEFNQKYSFISSEVSNYSGFFNPRFNRYICEPLNSFDDPSINELIIQWGSQTGKSYLLSLGMIFRIWKYNSNCLYLLPSDQQAKQMVRERILPIMKNNSEILKLFPEDDDLITLQNMKLNNCNLHFNGSGNASKLAGFSGIVIGDECQKWESKSRHEASAISLAKQRVKSLSKAEQLFVLSSTPTIEDGVESITYHLNRSDYRQYYIKCLECGEFNKISFSKNESDFYIEFENETFENGQRNMNLATSTAKLVCSCCNSKFDDAQKNQMVNDPSSHWKATNDLADESIRGYQLSSLYSYYFSLGDAVKTFLESKESISGLQNFMNGCMGLEWKDKKIDTPDIISMKDLEGELERGELPKESSFNLLIADVQKGYFFYMVISIDEAGFIYVIENGKALDWAFLKSEKDKYNCQYALVDSRYQTAEVIENLSELGEDWIAVRAFEKLAGNAFHDVVLVDSISGQKAKGGISKKVREFRINLLHYKSLFFRMRNRELPNLVIYKDMDIDLAKHLIGEVQIEKTDRNGRTKIVFEAISKRVDYLDCLVYGISFSYFLRGTRAYKKSNSKEGTRKKDHKRMRKFNI